MTPLTVVEQSKSDSILLEHFTTNLFYTCTHKHLYTIQWIVNKLPPLWPPGFSETAEDVPTFSD